MPAVQQTSLKYLLFIIKGVYIKREEEDNDSDDEYIDVDDSFVPKM